MLNLRKSYEQCIYHQNYRLILIFTEIRKFISEKHEVFRKVSMNIPADGAVQKVKHSVLALF